MAAAESGGVSGQLSVVQLRGCGWDGAGVVVMPHWGCGAASTLRWRRICRTNPEEFSARLKTSALLMLRSINLVFVKHALHAGSANHRLTKRIKKDKKGTF